MSKPADRAVEINKARAIGEHETSPNMSASANWQMELNVALGALAALPAVFYTHARVIRPILGMTNAMKRLAGGDKAVGMPGWPRE